MAASSTRERCDIFFRLIFFVSTFLWFHVRDTRFSLARTRTCSLAHMRSPRLFERHRSISFHIVSFYLEFFFFFFFLRRHRLGTSFFFFIIIVAIAFVVARRPSSAVAIAFECMCYSSLQRCRFCFVFFVQTWALTRSLRIEVYSSGKKFYVTFERFRLR